MYIIEPEFPRVNARGRITGYTTAGGMYDIMSKRKSPDQKVQTKRSNDKKVQNKRANDQKVQIYQKVRSLWMILRILSLSGSCACTAASAS